MYSASGRFHFQAWLVPFFPPHPERAAVSAFPRACSALPIFRRQRLNLQIHTRNLTAAFRGLKAGTPAKLRKSKVPVWTQFYTGADQGAVHIDALAALKLEEQTHHTRIIRSPAQHPSPATKNCSRHKLHQPARLRDAHRFHLERPWGLLRRNALVL